MALVQQIRALTSAQRRTFTACFLGWSLDAFDFFLLTYCLDSVAAEFHVGLKTVAESLFWTLAMRPVGALVFGLLAERVGRRPTLMLNVVCFSGIGLLTAFAPSWHSFLLIRAVFGIAMGGEWGVGAALALESLPAEGRGFFSGLLQEGYVTGNLVAAAVAGGFGLFVAHVHPIGFAASWRMLFVLGAVPSLVVLWLLFGVEESPVWLAAIAAKKQTVVPVVDYKLKVRRMWGLVAQFGMPFCYMTVLMFCFTSFSHGTQDLYATFVKHDYGLSVPVASGVAIVGNVGAFVGGLLFGSLSEKLGRRRAIVVAALLAIPMIPLWAWSHTAAMLAAGGFLMQVCVQGAWGVIPVHLNELSPAAVRAVFPGLAYQLGNLLSARNSVFQAEVAIKFYGGRLGPALAWTVLIVAVLVAAVTALGRQARGANLQQV